jgi:hypothetical protein
MAHTFNFRNNTDLYAKIAGVFEDKVITPNSEIEDKTIQWIESSSTGSKQIQLFSTEDCNTAPSVNATVRWDSDGIYVTKGSTPGDFEMVVDMKTVSWEVHPVITGTTEETIVSGDELPQNLKLIFHVRNKLNKQNYLKTPTFGGFLFIRQSLSITFIPNEHIKSF